MTFFRSGLPAPTRVRRGDILERLMKDLYVKVVLTVIAVCLVVLVCGRVDINVLPIAHAGDAMGKINYAKDGGVGVACSNDGKYVFVAGTAVFGAPDYGEAIAALRRAAAA